MDTHHSKLEGKESAGLTLELQGHPLGSAAPTDFGVIRVNVEYSGHSLRKKSKQVTIPDFWNQKQFLVLLLVATFKMAHTHGKGVVDPSALLTLSPSGHTLPLSQASYLTQPHRVCH